MVKSDAPFPRINIDAFGESTELLDALNAAKENRLMNRVTVTKNRGNVHTAVQHYSGGKPVPDLILIEATQLDDEFFASLTQLGGMLPRKTHAIVLGHSNDVRISRRLNELGTSDYLVPPFSGDELLRAIGGVFNHANNKSGHVTAIMGAVGGAGASLIAINLADAITRMASNVMMVDLNLGFGTTALDLNETTSFDPTHLYADEVGNIDQTKIDKSLIQTENDKIRILPTPPHLSASGWSPQPANITRLLDESRALTPTILLDMPCLWAPWTIECFKNATNAVVVTTPTLQGLNNLKKLVQGLKGLGHTPHVIVNGCGMAKRDEAPIEHFQRVADGCKLITVKHDQVFDTASTKGAMIHALQPKCEAVQVFNLIAADILGRAAVHEAAVTTEVKSSSIISNLLGRFGRRAA